MSVANFVVVCTKTGKKNKIIYNSGLIYFRDKKSRDLFEEEISLRDSKIEVHRVDIKKAHEPKDIGRGLYCPYCQKWSEWSKREGTKYCTICDMSDQDFYVKQMNHRWRSED